MARVEFERNRNVTDIVGLSSHFCLLSLSKEFGKKALNCFKLIVWFRHKFGT